MSNKNITRKPALLFNKVINLLEEFENLKNEASHLEKELQKFLKIYFEDVGISADVKEWQNNPLRIAIKRADLELFDMLSNISKVNKKGKKAKIFNSLEKIQEQITQFKQEKQAKQERSKQNKPRAKSKQNSKNFDNSQNPAPISIGGAGSASDFDIASMVNSFDISNDIGNQALINNLRELMQNLIANKFKIKQEIVKFKQSDEFALSKKIFVMKKIGIDIMPEIKNGFSNTQPNRAIDIVPISELPKQHLKAANIIEEPKEASHKKKEPEMV